MFQIGTDPEAYTFVQKDQKYGQAVFVCLFVFHVFFSNKCRPTSKAISSKDILLSALDVTKFARCQSGTCVKNLIFQNGTPCKSETCFRMAHVSERHATRVLLILYKCIMLI